MLFLIDQALPSHPRDVEALKASRLAKVNKNTTHRVYGLLRRRVVELAHAEAAPFAGCVEVDK